jgi:hypothetical protein
LSRIPPGFPIGTTATLKAIAYASGMSDSAVGSAVYTIQVATPTFSPTAGTYASPQTVAISTTTSGAAIRYTTDGTTPTSSTGTVYSSPVAVSTSGTLKAIAYNASMADSAVGSASYTILPPVATPTFSPAAGTYTSTQSVTISTTTSGASIRYTTDGSTPTSSTGTLYSAPLTVSTTTTIKAIGYMTGIMDSTVASATLTIQAATPTFSPVAGSYPSAQTVTISTTTVGASIRYTTNGVTPSSTVGSLYTGPITFGQTLSFKAIAYKAGVTDSAIASATLAITSITSPQGVATVATSGWLDVLAVPVGTPTAINVATWSVINGQDDLEWTPSTNQGGGVWKGQVNLSHHQSSTAVDYGVIAVHVQQTGGPNGDLLLGGADFSRYIPNVAILNPSFETGSLSSWQPFSTAANAKTAAAARTGSYGLSQASGDGGVFQDFDGLLPGNVYKISVWVKCPDPTPPLWSYGCTTPQVPISSARELSCRREHGNSLR